MNFEMWEMGKSFSEIFSISKSVEWNLRTKFSLSECQQVANRENWRESRTRNSVVQFYLTARLVYSILCFVRFEDTMISLIFAKAKTGVSLWNEVRGWDWARLSVKGKNIVKKKKKKIFETLRINLSSRSIVNQLTRIKFWKKDRRTIGSPYYYDISLNKFH